MGAEKIMLDMIGMKEENESKRNWTKRWMSWKNLLLRMKSAQKLLQRRKTERLPAQTAYKTSKWRKFEPAQRTLARSYQKLIEDNNMIKVWWSTGRTVLLPKTKDLSEKKLLTHEVSNISDRVLAGIIAKYIEYVLW